ncbi:hypothetical protein K466DRAFT_172320 [Polyporus arcularius HHB13444]|uniref:Uncharacterized protein n=1 Tax=Polyporus arcularius HHB13444 TaxID=1314778 RepID=A0A5C3P8T8_9APHY|nr:hypothetical protein K466DRAFT_172320 [Polyporus arcularius HHB13444]
MDDYYVALGRCKRQTRTGWQEPPPDPSLSLNPTPVGCHHHITISCYYDTLLCYSHARSRDSGLH